MKLPRSDGFTLVESVIAGAVLLVILGGVMMKVTSITDHIRKTEQILALDSLESWLAPLLTDLESLRYSASLLKDKQLQACLEGKLPCRSDRDFPLPVFLKGQKNPISGAGSRYDANGNLCFDDKCEAYQVNTVVQTNCSVGAVCESPSFLTIRYDIVDSKSNKTIRKFFLEANRFRNKRFPNLYTTCVENQVLRGLGINGEPLCVALSDIKLKNSAGDIDTGQIQVKAKDCAEANSDDRDQFYVRGMNRQGDLLCAKRFW
ncbi:hypothetical protein [Pseudobacteriovorax antillogorgiicola]|uniref:Prepilin-type N-terminal cleavage/methylation domain-containing protein n=1 Tax=Pseudobacteriovorax antillogorgiicola TaxID=1513793 RepID=A0A1Y6CP35_9BACT|nr:hypothetical protein [Pseudobacteriovorax antillogorgiicola]TCS44596.1 hypothetical protein EDD56_13229 [Pseudobacteriovorax antillogorgiicola]SMF78139.1 hypothetical protein SAMN06296036_13229 [Pseudobacteriovorax antillogorgiicola]